MELGEREKYVDIVLHLIQLQYTKHTNFDDEVAEKLIEMGHGSFNKTII